jgi:hypothetical protein
MATGRRGLSTPDTAERRVEMANRAEVWDRHARACARPLSAVPRAAREGPARAGSERRSVVGAEPFSQATA